MARLSLERETLRRTNAIRTLRAIGPLALLAAMTASCFITSTPDFKPPPQTPPFLISAGASPRLGSLVIYDPSVPKPLIFSAPVRSEDAGDPVQVELLTDYGFTAPDGRPFSDVQEGANVLPAAFSETARVAQVQWIPKQFSTPCHRFTLMVSHDIVRGDGCPADLTDSDFLSWNVIVCNGIDPCPPMLDPSTACGAMMDDIVSCPATSGGM